MKKLVTATVALLALASTACDPGHHELDDRSATVEIDNLRAVASLDERIIVAEVEDLTTQQVVDVRETQLVEEASEETQLRFAAHEAIAQHLQPRDVDAAGDFAAPPDTHNATDCSHSPDGSIVACHYGDCVYIASQYGWCMFCDGDDYCEDWDGVAF